MIGQTAIRLYILSAVVLATFGIAKWEKHALQPPEVQLPSWAFHEMPLQFGDWRGEDTELDPKITAAVGAALLTRRQAARAPVPDDLRVTVGRK